MAWISVHEQVIGGKLRSLAKAIGCSQNEALGILVRLWLWGINNADEDGQIIGADKEDVAEVLTIGIDSRYSPADVTNALLETAWLDADDGLFIHDWKEWQEQWYRALKVREGNAERKRKERERKRNAIQNSSSESQKEPQAELSMPKLNISTDNENVTKRQIRQDYPSEFNQFWDAYPRKIEKGNAYKMYQARLNCGWKPEELIEAAKNYALKVARERTEIKYIKHPKTFLSANEPFVDFLPKREIKSVDTNGNEDDPYAEWR